MTTTLQNDEQQSNNIKYKMKCVG